jgi:hypothetical protein
MRGKAPALCKSVIDMAVELKAAKMGTRSVPPVVLPPFTCLEIKSMFAACQLLDGAVLQLDAAMMVPDGGHE